MLANRIVLVTNVQHFVGLPVAEELAAQNAVVVCHDAGFAYDEARTAFAAAHPGLFAAEEQSPAGLVDMVVSAHGRIDVLVNNDAFPAIRAPVEDARIEDLRAGLEAMVVRPFAMAAAVAPRMKAQKAGKILFVTSATPLRGLPNYAMYVTARGAANALAVSLAKELARDNVQVNAVAPNFVESPTYFPPELLADPDTVARIARNVPLGRLGRPDEIAALIAFLASERSDFLTGQVIPFAGGWA